MGEDEAWLGGKMFEEEEPNSQTRACREALGCSFKCLTKKGVLQHRELSATKDLVILQNFTTKLLHKPRAFLASLPSKLEVQAFLEHSVLIPGYP